MADKWQHAHDAANYADIQSPITPEMAADILASLGRGEERTVPLPVACGHPECEADRWPMEDGGAACHRAYAGTR